MQLGQGLIRKVELGEESRDIRGVLLVLLLEDIALVGYFLKVIDIAIRQRASKLKVSQEALVVANFIINIFAQRIQVDFF